MITLNAITLSPHLKWVDEFEFSSIAMTSNRTIGGGLVTFSTAITAGRPITLVGGLEQGWITKSMVTDLGTMSSAVGAIYPLVFYGFTANVMFNHSNAPAFKATPLLSKQVADLGDYYTTTIKLITV